MFENIQKKFENFLKMFVNFLKRNFGCKWNLEICKNDIYFFERGKQRNFFCKQFLNTVNIPNYNF